MTPTERSALIAEAKRRADAEHPDHRASMDSAMRADAFGRHLLDLIESKWRPEPEVDAVTLAAREWMKSFTVLNNDLIDTGQFDEGECVRAFRAGHAHALVDHAANLATVEALVLENRRMREALERMSRRAWGEPWPDHYAPEPPEWAKDDFNGDSASKCGYCGAWMSVVRPGKVQCDCCSDGEDFGALARQALETTNDQ